ncbi:hypothetical protein [Solicola sp. PLA-1-18]|uniref:hypothetical protein n=1 Tax=Solicola sp. PLA-1-18 TaxID=3380532 RepID=UPI003B7669F2
MAAMLYRWLGGELDGDGCGSTPGWTGTVSGLWVPALILAYKFAMRVMIDKEVSFPDFIKQLLSLPIDISFLAVSLVAGLLVVTQDVDERDLALLVASMIVGAVAVFLSRRSDRFFTESRIGMLFVPLTINLFITVGLLVYIVSYIQDGMKA